MQNCNFLVERCNFPVEQSYRVVSGKDYEHEIKTMFNMEDPPSIVHPITNKTRTPDGFLILWGRPVIFEITKSADQLKEDSVQVVSELYKKKYPNCLFVVIIERVKSPREKDKLDSIYDGLTKLIDYVLIGEKEVNEFVKSPKQPINNYKLKLKQLKTNVMNVNNVNKPQLNNDLLGHLIRNGQFEEAEAYYEGVRIVINVMDLRADTKYFNSYNFNEAMWIQKCEIFDTAITLDSIPIGKVPLWKKIKGVSTANALPEVSLLKLKGLFSQNKVYKVKSKNKLGWEFYV